MMPRLGVGTHDVTVKNCGFQPIKDGKPPQFAIYFEDANGDSITWWTTLGYIKDGTFSMAAYDFAADQLRGLGWDDVKQNFAFEELADPATSPIFERAAVLVVVNEPFNGVDKIKVKFINDPGRVPGGGERMDATTASQFAGMLREKLRSAGRPVTATFTRPGTTTAPRPAAPAPTTAPASGPTGVRAGYDPFADIPF